MASPRHAHKKPQHISGIATTHSLPLIVGNNAADDTSYSKEHKPFPSVSIALQRLILRFRVFPRPIQAMLILSAMGICLLIFSFQHVHNPSTSPYTPRKIELKEYNNKGPLHISNQPRVLQMMDDRTSAEPMDPEQMVPRPGLIELVGRDNPLPKNKNSKMKLASTLDKGGCQRIEDWQIGQNPTCNILHESSIGWNHMFSDRNPKDIPDDVDEDEEYEQAIVQAGGAFRHVWMIREFDGTKRALKTLRVDGRQDFDLRNTDRHRRDAISTDELTSSPLVVDIYGYCSNSALYDWGEGGDLESIFERDPNITKDQLLKIAYNVSLSIHHIHNFNELGRPTIAHTDIKVDQFLYQDGYYRLTDFNRVRFLMWNEEKNLQCGFHVAKNGGVWRSPEEYNYEVETEKVDVYSLGNVLYFLLTREIPWNDYAAKAAYKLVKDGKRPAIPTEILTSDHPYDKYMMEAINMAYTHDMHERPGALQIANKLKEGIDEL